MIEDMVHDKRTLPSFTLTLKAKLRTNANRSLTDTAHVDYAVSRPEGKAMDIVMSHVDENTGQLDIATVANLLTTLKEGFADPDPTNTAGHELQHLTQGKGDFASCYTEFPRIVSKLKYNEAAKSSALAQGMSKGLKDAMVTMHNEDHSYSQYVELFQRVNNKQCARKEEKVGHRIGHFTASPPPSH